MIQTSESAPATIKEISKSQTIRLADVFFIGPLMIYAGSKKKITPFVDNSLMVLGLLTMGYNGKNYLENEKYAKITKEKT